MKLKRNNGCRPVAPPARTSTAQAPSSRAQAAPLRRVGTGGDALALAVAAVLYLTTGTPVQAADVPAAEPAETTGNDLNEIVVTASAQGVKKLDASYNIVTVTLDDIKNANPASVAEVFKLSPGIWPESSGGQTGVNIDVAGFPNGGGDSPYFTTMIQGSPLYGSADLSFMDSSSLVRLDDTVERVEIVQGGPSAIFSSGQAGATANFILRTGSDKTEGSVGFTYGSEGAERVDAFYSGKIIDGWYGSIGGFYRESNGVRNPQYPADIGGQLTATLKHDLDGGSLMFWYRILSDKNQWVADFPYVVNGNGAVSAYPGFNQLNNTYNSKQLQNLLIPGPGGGFENDDISNGRGAQLNYFGSNLKLNFGNGLSITNTFLFDGGYLPTNALVNNGNPSSLTAYIAGLTLPSALAAGAVQAHYADGVPVPATQSVITEQVWQIRKKLLNVTDEFRVAMDLGAGNTLTAGLYTAFYRDNDAWALGSNVLMNNVPNASPIILQGAAGGNIYNVTSPQGVIANGGYNILEQGSAVNIAAYLSDSWKVEQWLFDASVRVEHINMHQQTSNLTSKQLGSAYDLWDNAVNLPNGTYSPASENNTMPTFSVGANYEFSDHMSAYVRINDGVFFDNFDAVRCNINNGSNGCPANPPLSTVRNYEGGFKIQNRYTYVDLAIYDKTFKGLPYKPVNIVDEPIGPPTTYGTESKGGRLVGSVNPLADMDMQPLRDFKIQVNANYENAKYQNFVGCALYNNINGQTVCGSVNGNQLARLPKFQVRVTPSDMQAFDWGAVTEYVMYEHVGQHYQDNTNLNPLGSYYDLGAGIIATVGDKWEFRLLGSNLTNQFGLTEGNARVGGNAVQNNVGFGRSIVGREGSIEAKYKF